MVKLGYVDLEKPSSISIYPINFEAKEKISDAIEEYSWWSYMGKARERNTGWRIDYFITSKRLDDKIQEAKIHQQIFGSDHCPVELDIDL